MHGEIKKERSDADSTGLVKTNPGKLSLVGYLIFILAACLLVAYWLKPAASIENAPERPSALAAGNPLKGRNVFVTKGCIECHATWGAGGKTAPDLARLGMGRSLLQIAGAMWNHSPAMVEAMQQRGVARSAISSEEMSDFISYLYYINYNSDAGNRGAGEKLFEEKGCSSCHSIKGRGAELAPSLDDYQRYRNALFVAQAMWNHGPQMIDAMRESGIAKPMLEGREAADLMAFIRGQSATEIPDDKFMLPGSPTTGRRLFTEKGCASCHAIDSNAVATGPDLTKAGAHKSVVEIAGAMWNHSAEIWQKMEQAGIARPTFSGNEMADIVSYLYFLRYTDKPGDPVAGKRLFEAKGCAACHSEPFSLSRSSALASPTALMAAMWNHAPVMESLAEQKRITWPLFQGDEMRDMIEYLKSQAAKAKQINE